MGQEVIHEKDFPCPCGQGVLRVEVLEHDTWGSGRHSRWSLRCSACETRYVEPFLLDALVLREHGYEIQRRRDAIFEQRKAVGNKASESYLAPFKEHVKSLRFKTAMHAALGGHESIQTFRARTRGEQDLDEAIEVSLKRDPARALKRINIEDEQIALELDSIAKNEAELKAFIEQIPKYPIPKIDD